MKIYYKTRGIKTHPAILKSGCHVKSDQKMPWSYKNTPTTKIETKNDFFFFNMSSLILSVFFRIFLWTWVPALAPHAAIAALWFVSETSTIGGRDRRWKHRPPPLLWPWYLWWSMECEGKSHKPLFFFFFTVVIMESRQEAERVAAYSSLHHLPTTHTWLKDLCKLWELHHLYLTPSEISRAAATVNIDKMPANAEGGSGNSIENDSPLNVCPLCFICLCGNLRGGFSQIVRVFQRT